MNRKTFIKNGIISAIALGPVNSLLSKPAGTNSSYDTELIEEFVKAGHNDLQKVKALLEKYPNLISSRYDWGGGDFEEAIEGAGHVGDKEIVDYLISRGARINILIMTMLGKTRIVKSIIDLNPNIINIIGPHGFTLLHYAKMGGNNSRDLYNYLSDKGLKSAKLDIF